MAVACSRRLPVVRSAALLLLVTLVACDPVDRVMERLGVRAGPDGAVIVTYAACPGERITHLFLTERVKGVQPGDEGVVRWSVEGEASGLFEATVGIVPPGFVESVSLREPLSMTSRFSIEVDSDNQAIAGNTFGLQELREDLLLSDVDEHLSRAEFEARATRICTEEEP